MSRDHTTPQSDHPSGQTPELKRWRPPAEDKAFEKGAGAANADAAGENHPDAQIRKVHAPHAKTADEPLGDDEKHDQLAHKADQSEDRQEALIDEGVEETFPASDPVSVKRIT